MWETHWSTTHLKLLSIPINLSTHLSVSLLLSLVGMLSCSRNSWAPLCTPTPAAVNNYQPHFHSPSCRSTYHQPLISKQPQRRTPGHHPATATKLKPSGHFRTLHNMTVRPGRKAHKAIDRSTLGRRGVWKDAASFHCLPGTRTQTWVERVGTSCAPFRKLETTSFCGACLIRELEHNAYKIDP